ncbi:hypothetical protein [Chryseobacterium chendengshani]|uniref:hypothetical protein n=1 Tax=Chryseobacterium sp. LJ756 TaxID=2864113 RepID=UPI001C63F5F7|nr:hypothetical protein [Chryseobacterium sp. LJ756]
MKPPYQITSQIVNLISSIFSEGEFPSKDYMKKFSDISSATASSDLKNAVEIIWLKNQVIKNKYLQQIIKIKLPLRYGSFIYFFNELPASYSLLLPQPVMEPAFQ